jgi:hypothetical protein
MVDRFRGKIEEQYKRGMITIPVDVKDPFELLTTMCLAVMVNNRMTPKQKDHCIDNILNHDLHRVAWFTKEYQLARLQYQVRASLSGIPSDVKRTAVETITKASIENRVTSILESFITEKPVDETLEKLSRELKYPKGYLELEYTILKTAGLIEEIEGKAKLTERGVIQLASETAIKEKK